MNREDLDYKNVLQKKQVKKNHKKYIPKTTPTKYYLLLYNEEYNETNVIGINCVNEIVYKRWLKAKVNVNRIKVYTGEYGDEFGEEFFEYVTNQEIVDAGKVQSYEVSEEFYNIFHATILSTLNNCNIFDLY